MLYRVTIIFAADGYTYERSAIMEWFRSGKVSSPMTNTQLDPALMIPNNTLKAAILAYSEQLNNR